MCQSTNAGIQSIATVFSSIVGRSISTNFDFANYSTWGWWRLYTWWRTPRKKLSIAKLACSHWKLHERTRQSCRLALKLSSSKHFPIQIWLCVLPCVIPFNSIRHSVIGTVHFRFHIFHLHTSKLHNVRLISNAKTQFISEFWNKSQEVVVRNVIFMVELLVAAKK